MECVPDAPCIGWSSNYVIVTPFKEVAADREALPLTYDSSTLVARRLRSSAINPIYYNPEVRYLPWLKASGERYPQYAPAEAPIDPNDLSRRANLVAMQLISGRWAKDINARTGARVAVLDTGAGSPGAPNGLGGVKLVRDSAKRIVAAYAGDLYGNLWKFDFSSSTPSEWRVAFDGYPLFRAANSSGQAEPITAAPAVMAHPLGGLMVLLGSGKLLEADDASSTAERSLYGVWDKVPPGSNTGLATDRVADNDLLVTQTISRLTINDKSGTYFAITSNSVDYGTGNAGKKRGWKIRMSIASGQRLIHAPQGYSGRVIFDTMVPGGIAAGCTATQPQGYTFVIDPFTGAPGRDGPTFDTSGDGDFTAADNVTAGVTWVSSIGNRGIVRVPGGTRVRLEGSAPPGMPRNPGNCKLEEGCTPSQFPSTPVKRQWRQIVTPPSY
jgi:Tfp pilus tip-associated adhesin PilY1